MCSRQRCPMLQACHEPGSALATTQPAAIRCVHCQRHRRPTVQCHVPYFIIDVQTAEMRHRGYTAARGCVLIMASSSQRLAACHSNHQSNDALSPIAPSPWDLTTPLCLCERGPPLGLYIKPAGGSAGPSREAGSGPHVAYQAKPHCLSWT